MKRYTYYLAYETLVNLLKMTCFFVGSYDPLYYSRILPDGYTFIRMSLVGLDILSFNLLAMVILVEPHFLAAFRSFLNLQPQMPLDSQNTEHQLGLLGDEEAFEQGLKDTTELKLFRKNTALVSEHLLNQALQEGNP